MSKRRLSLRSALETVVVQAGAGTGKTSTLVAIAKATKRIGQFVAFNKKVVLNCLATGAAPSPAAR